MPSRHDRLEVPTRSPVGSLEFDRRVAELGLRRTHLRLIAEIQAVPHLRRHFLDHSRVQQLHAQRLLRHWIIQRSHLQVPYSHAQLQSPRSWVPSIWATPLKFYDRWHLEQTLSSLDQTWWIRAYFHQLGQVVWESEPEDRGKLGSKVEDAHTLAVQSFDQKEIAIDPGTKIKRVSAR